MARNWKSGRGFPTNADGARQLSLQSLDLVKKYQALKANIDTQIANSRQHWDSIIRQISTEEGRQRMEESANVELALTRDNALRNHGDELTRCRKELAEIKEAASRAKEMLADEKVYLWASQVHRPEVVTAVNFLAYVPPGSLPAFANWAAGQKDAALTAAIVARVQALKAEKNPDGSPVYKSEIIENLFGEDGLVRAVIGDEMASAVESLRHVELHHEQVERAHRELENLRETPTQKIKSALDYPDRIVTRDPADFGGEQPSGNPADKIASALAAKSAA